MKTTELERTYLAKQLPSDLKSSPSKLVVDVYFPTSAAHPTLRFRQYGDAYEVTKKVMASGHDSSRMIEHTIALSQAEFEELTAHGGKRVAKQRYFYELEGREAQIDVFQEALQGLVLADFEFTNREEQLQFSTPDFCLAEVTQEAFLAGGKLAGAAYQDIAAQLDRYSYKPIKML